MSLKCGPRFCGLFGPKLCPRATTKSPESCLRIPICVSILLEAMVVCTKELRRLAVSNSSRNQLGLNLASRILIAPRPHQRRTRVAGGILSRDYESVSMRSTEDLETIGSAFSHAIGSSSFIINRSWRANSNFPIFAAQ